ncbi:hypothetical protein Bca4012_054673 [Brassica carinata]
MVEMVSVSSFSTVVRLQQRRQLEHLIVGLLYTNAILLGSSRRLCGYKSHSRTSVEKEETESTSTATVVFSLPDVIILNCLARVSKSYYPKLSLVSKTFRSLILSIELNHARFYYQTQEDVFYICLQLPDRPLPTWFSLWIKPDEEEKRRSIFVQVPSSYDSREPLSICTVIYALRQRYPPSPFMLVRNKGSVVVWRNAPNMTVPRAYPAACELDGKIYVMGGCNDGNKSVNKSCWGEVFDTNTQTWEPLPNPKAKLRFSSVIKEIEISEGKLYVRSNEDKDSVYDPKKRKWNVAEKEVEGESRCMVGSVLKYGLGARLGGV